jgi:hypothetical protein
LQKCEDHSGISNIVQQGPPLLTVLKLNQQHLPPPLPHFQACFAGIPVPSL